ncbi:response regulator [Motiliproteus sp.]|uniref:response regulator n=1 Tax=Motiliproteus sp. TaxID=1898955 RepID=UPI003BABF7EF
MDKTILIVDDEPSIRNLLDRMLSRWGYDVQQACDGLDALSVLDSNPDIRLVLSDLRMPHCNGLEFMQRASQKYKRDFEFIVLTGDGEKHDAVQAMRMGAREFLDKPIDRADLEQAVQGAQDRLEQRDHEKTKMRKLEVANLQQARFLDEADEQLIDRLAVIAQYRDVETAEHCVRVGLNAELLARLAGLDLHTQHLVRLAGVLHDIGKIGIPDNILFKEGPLSFEEFEIMKRHTDIGFSMLTGSGTELIDTAACIAKTHHERWDGTGYNDGLHQEETPIFGRLVTIADVYDALRSKRRYKPAFSHLEAVKVITQGDGRTDPNHFDPKLLNLFREHHQRFAEIYDSMPDEAV